MEPDELYVGKPIAFVPDGWTDPEYGFVTSWNDHFVFCRFFRNEQSIKLRNLRTVANSEACEHRDLQPFPLDPENINDIIAAMRKDPVTYGWIEQEQS